jgi:UPF0176 protein
MSNTVAAFYQFLPLPDPAGLKALLVPYCDSLGLRGTILLAHEGINGNLAGAERDIRAFIAALQSGSYGGPGFGRLELKYSKAGDEHFDRLKIKVKAEIITFGQNLDSDQRVGTYVAPADWNKLLDDPDVVVLDTRNDFEVAMGSFAGARDPGLTSFSQFPAFVRAQMDPAAQKKVAMFCTGGIRCEKASAYMLAAGFAEVYHLQGGILKYLEEVPAAVSKWQGDCFVFDRRVALGHGLEIKTPDIHANLLDSARRNIAE